MKRRPSPSSTTHGSSNAPPPSSLRRDGETPAHRAHIQSSAGVVTPSLFNSVYKISSNIGYASASQLVYESLNQYYSPSDLTTYQNLYGIPVHGVTYDINGHSSDSVCVFYSSSCDEANLDVQVLTSISQYPTTTTYYYTDDFSTWVQYMADLANPPLVQSASYGATDSDVPASYFLSFNMEAVKVGCALVVYLVMLFSSFV